MVSNYKFDCLVLPFGYTVTLGIIGGYYEELRTEGFLYTSLEAKSKFSVAVRYNSVRDTLVVVE